MQRRVQPQRIRPVIDQTLPIGRQWPTRVATSVAGMSEARTRLPKSVATGEVMSISSAPSGESIAGSRTAQAMVRVIAQTTHVAMPAKRASSGRHQR